jgi:hypothetical protein
VYRLVGGAILDLGCGFRALALTGATLLASLVLAAAAPSASAAGWAPLGVLSDTGAGAPDVAVGANGTAVAVWRRGDRIEAAVRPPGGGFGAAAPVSPATEAAGQPAVAINAAGYAVAVWASETGGSERIRAAKKAPASASFAASTIVQNVPKSSSQGIQGLDQPDVAVDPEGTAVAVWHWTKEVPPPSGQSGTRQSSIDAAASGPGAASFVLESTTVESFDGPYDATIVIDEPHVTFDASGTAVAAWRRQIANCECFPPGQTSDHNVSASHRLAVTGFQQNETVLGSSQTIVQRFPSVAAGGSEVFVVWSTDDEVKGSMRIGGDFAVAPQPIFSGVLIKPPGPAVAADAGGTAAAIWATGQQRVLASLRSPGGAFGPATPISGDPGSGEVEHPKVASNPFGTMIAVWSRSGSEPAGINASIRTAGGVFGPPEPVPGATAGSDSPELETDSVGDAVTVWRREDRIEAALYDGDPPPQVPGVAGQTGVPAPDRTAPEIASFALSRGRFAVGPGRTPLAAARGRRRRAKRGTSFRYALSEAAAVRISIKRRLAGRRVRGRCRPVTRKTRRRARCVRLRHIGTLRRAARQGANSTPFSGRLGRKALRRGRYEATIGATDAAGNKSRSRSVRFAIVRF